MQSNIPISSQLSLQKNENHKDHLSSFLSTVILLFFVVIQPLYRFLENENLALLRNYFYLAALLASVILFISFLRKVKSGSTFFSLLLLSIYFGWISLILSSTGAEQSEWVKADVITLTYSFQALALGTNLSKLSKKKFFLNFILIIWLVTCFFVISKVDPTFYQASYGEISEDFKGAYLYIGDTFSFISIMLVSGMVKTNLRAMTGVSYKTLTQAKKTSAYCFIFSLLIISITILFFNGSRGSLFSFIIFSLYISYQVFKRMNLFLISFLSLLLISFLYFFISVSPNYNINYDFLLRNRNFEIISEGGSTSWESRNDLYEMGIQSILDHPIVGNYSERELFRGRGSYIHNLSGLIEDFGIYVFLSYTTLLFYYIQKCLSHFRRNQQNNYVSYIGIMIFSTTQIIFFRFPLGFFIMFIGFGMTLRSDD